MPFYSIDDTPWRPYSVSVFIPGALRETDIIR